MVSKKSQNNPTLFMVVFFLLTAISFFPVCSFGQVKCLSEADLAIIENVLIRMEYDLSKGTYRAVNKKDNSVFIREGYFKLNDYSSSDPVFSHTWSTSQVKDSLGTGRVLSIQSTGMSEPKLLFNITLYDDKQYVVLAAGIKNTTDKIIQLKTIEPMAEAKAFEDFDLSKNFSMLDGNGGGENTIVVHSGHLSCRNNLLVTV